MTWSEISMEKEKSSGRSSSVMSILSSEAILTSAKKSKTKELFSRYMSIQNR
jgi:hypothetical protein